MAKWRGGEWLKETCQYSTEEIAKEEEKVHNVVVSQKSEISFRMIDTSRFS